MRTKNEDTYVLIFLITFMADCSQCIYADTRKDETNALMLQFTALCKKIERDCYFDCGRNINSKSMILDSLWLWCTNQCDIQFQLCLDKMKKAICK